MAHARASPSAPQYNVQQSAYNVQPMQPQYYAPPAPAFVAPPLPPSSYDAAYGYGLGAGAGAGAAVPPPYSSLGPAYDNGSHQAGAGGAGGAGAASASLPVAGFPYAPNSQATYFPSVPQLPPHGQQRGAAAAAPSSAVCVNTQGHFAHEPAVFGRPETQGLCSLCHKFSQQNGRLPRAVLLDGAPVPVTAPLSSPSPPPHSAVAGYPAQVHAHAHSHSHASGSMPCRNGAGHLDSEPTVFGSAAHNGLCSMCFKFAQDNGRLPRAILLDVAPPPTVPCRNTAGHLAHEPPVFGAAERDGLCSMCYAFNFEHNRLPRAVLTPVPGAGAGAVGSGPVAVVGKPQVLYHGPPATAQMVASEYAALHPGATVTITSSSCSCSRRGGCRRC